MNVFAKFDEIPSKTLQDIKETKRHGHTFVRSFVLTDNVKTVYPPTNTVCGGYNNEFLGKESYHKNTRSAYLLFKTKQGILAFRILSQFILTSMRQGTGFTS